MRCISVPLSSVWKRILNRFKEQNFESYFAQQGRDFYGLRGFLGSNFLPRQLSGTPGTGRSGAVESANETLNEE
jgi:hypothetical protein